MERSVGVRKGTWCKEEDDLLKASVKKYGEGKWHLIPQRAGLNRCRKSCRLRWLNHLKPDIKRGDFTRDEVDLMMKLHSLLGNRWSLIAARLPGRTANDVKNYWNYKIRKKGASHTPICSEITMKTQYTYEVIKPRPFTFSGNSSWLRTGKPKIAVTDDQDTTTTGGANEECSINIASPQQQLESSMEEWWESLVDGFEKGSGEEGNSSSSMSDYNREGKLDDQLWDIQELRWNNFPLHANLCDLPS